MFMISQVGKTVSLKDVVVDAEESATKFTVTAGNVVFDNAQVKSNIAINLSIAGTAEINSGSIEGVVTVSTPKDGKEKSAFTMNGGTVNIVNVANGQSGTRGSFEYIDGTLENLEISNATSTETVAVTPIIGEYTSGVVAKVVTSQNSAPVVTAFTTLKKAVETAPNEAVVTLLCDSQGDGIQLGTRLDFTYTPNYARQVVTIDFAGYTYTLDGSMEGSYDHVQGIKYRSSGFHIQPWSTLTLKNGKIKQGQSGAINMLHNYGYLTIENMILDGSNSEALVACERVICNNFNSVSIKGSTQIISAEGKAAINLWYGLNSAGYYDSGLTFTFENDFTGRVSGKVEYGAQWGVRNRESKDNWTEKTILTINGTGDWSDATFELSDGSETLASLAGANIVVNIDGKELVESSTSGVYVIADEA